MSRQYVLLDRDRGQLELDLRRVLFAAEDERLHDRAQPLERALVAAQLDRPRERPLERLARAEQARVDDVHDRPELAEPVLDRRAGHRQLPARGQPAQRPGALGRRVLDVLRLVEQEPVPGDPRERVGVAGGDVVGGDDDVAVRGDQRERRSRQPAHTVVEVDAQRRREPLDLGAPLANDAHRADDERRTERLTASLLALRDEHRDRLHRLAEAHVVGQDRADPEVAEEPQPAVAALLEGEEVELHRGRRRQRAEAPLAVAEQLRERRVERHLAELEPRLVGLEAGDGADELDDPGARAAPLEEAQRSLDVGLAERMPAAGDPDERLLRGGELGELLLREGDVADREPPVEARERRRREQSARASRRPLVAVRLTLRRLGVRSQAAREQDGDAALLEPRHRLAEERRRPRPARAPPRPGSAPSSIPPPPAAARSRRAARIRSRRGSLARRKEKIPSSPFQTSDGREARASGRPPPGARARARARDSSSAEPLVEMERELPRRRREPAEAVVDPAGEPPLERGVAGVPRQHGLGGGQPPRKSSSAPGRRRARAARGERRVARSRSRAIWSTRTG